MSWLLIVGFAVSSSIDNFGVGLSYGVQKIRIPVVSNLLMSAICLLFSLAGVVFGHWMSSLLPGKLPSIIAFGLLLAIGLRVIYLALPRESRPGKSFGKVQHILEHPESVDFDRSSHIGLGEATLLGVALSANALTNGLGAGLMELSPLAIALAASIGSYLTIWGGVALGEKVADVRIGTFSLGQLGTLLSGLIILAIAFTRLL